MGVNAATQVSDHVMDDTRAHSVMRPGSTAQTLTKQAGRSETHDSGRQSRYHIQK